VVEQVDVTIFIHIFSVYDERSRGQAIAADRLLGSH
jgi:hypothetical protein